MVEFVSGPYLWLVIAAIAALIEIVSVSLITVWFVIGGIVAFFVGFFGAPLWIQLIVFLAVSLAMLALLRPVVLRYRKQGASFESTPVGSAAIVVEEVGPGDRTGRVETPDHMTWTALSCNGSTIEVNTHVRVVEQDSIKLIVERM